MSWHPAWLSTRPAGLHRAGASSGEPAGPSLLPPGHRAVSTDSPRHGFLIRILIFSAPLSPRFSLEHKQHSACYSGAGHGTERGRHVSLLEDVTSQRGQGAALLGHLAGTAPPQPEEPQAQQLSGTVSGQRWPPLPGEKGAWGGPSQGTAPGSCTRRNGAGGPGGPCLTPRSTAHSRAGRGIPGTHWAPGSLTFGRAGPQPTHPQEDNRDGAGAGGSP